ncbi:MAG TPA: peptidoglycan-binding protein [Stellaceae bacterium]|jgi:peptidoglycan hydrolase-like protein with peptidoglycan-binding domain
MKTITRALFFLLVLWCWVPIAHSQTPASAGAADSEQAVLATPQLIREIQFMLLSVSIDPGPIDGNAQQFTNRAVRVFEERNGLPQVDLVNGRPVPADFLAKLRGEVAQNLLKNGAKPPEQPAAAAPPPEQPKTAALPPPAPADTTPAKPVPPPPDRFASCAYNPEDFRIGGTQFTPQAFLDQGFGGVTSRALTNLKQRLDEARQIAEKLGGPALVEVQRQSRVIAYFECRQKIEQAGN